MNVIVKAKTVELIGSKPLSKAQLVGNARIGTHQPLTRIPNMMRDGFWLERPGQKALLIRAPKNKTAFETVKVVRVDGGFWALLADGSVATTRMFNREGYWRPNELLFSSGQEKILRRMNDDDLLALESLGVVDAKWLIKARAEKITQRAKESVRDGAEYHILQLKEDFGVKLTVEQRRKVERSLNAQTQKRIKRDLERKHYR